MNRIALRRSWLSIVRTLHLVVVLLPALFMVGQARGQTPAISPEQSAKNQQTEPLVKAAQQHLEKAEWDAAIAQSDKALGVDANNIGALLARGDAFNGKGQYETAIAEFDKITALPGRDTEAVALRAEAFAHRSDSFYRQREYLKAIDSAYFAVLEKGDHVQAHTLRAMAYLERFEFDKAINSANRAIGVKPDDPTSAPALSVRGQAYAAKGNFDQSIADQKKAIELQPGLAVAYQRRGAALSAKGDFQNAYVDLEQALKLQPNMADAYCDRANLYYTKRDNAKALADLHEAIRVEPTSTRAHYSLALAMLNAEETDKAIASFDEAVKLNPKLAAAFCFRGYAHQAKNNHELAAKDFTQAIALDPQMIKAYQGRSIAYRKLAKPTEASADLAKVKELTPVKTPKGAKKEPELPPRFIVKSKAVDPKRAPQVAKSAQEIDRLIAMNYEKYKLQPNPKTTDEQFVRRIYLDITGTIPTYVQAKRFFSSKDPNKRALLIDELLSSDGYASHFFNYWVDVLRYTDNLNGNVRGEPYRQWIKQSLAEDKPWDKMVYEMLSAEGLVWSNPATGYLQRDAGMPLDNMNNTVRIFLGTRIGCAQCHDHPFDRWTQKEFYEMAAFTFGTATSTNGGDARYWKENPNDRLMSEFSEIEQEEEERRQRYYGFQRMIGFNQTIVNDHPEQKVHLPKNYQYTNAKPDDVVEPKTLFGEPAVVSPGESPRRAFAKWLTSKSNPRFGLTIANRLWGQAFGVGQIDPVDDMMDGTVAENPELMTFLESEIKRLDFSMKEYLRIVFNTETYQRQACFEEVPMGEPYHLVGPLLRRMTAEQVWDSFLTVAVVDPNEYREVPATLRTNSLGVDLSQVSAMDVLEAERKANAVDGSQWQREQKYAYKGVLLARASELPSPVPPNHFLRMFGQSDRELISTSSTSGSVPQVLLMFNGPVSHVLLEKNTTIYNTVNRKDDPAGGVRAIFLTILTREPDPEELELGKQEVKANGKAGYGNVIWSLVNTREFLFIQ